MVIDVWKSYTGLVDIVGDFISRADFIQALETLEILKFIPLVYPDWTNMSKPF